MVQTKESYMLYKSAFAVVLSSLVLTGCGSDEVSFETLESARSVANDNAKDAKTH